MNNRVGAFLVNPSREPAASLTAEARLRTQKIMLFALITGGIVATVVIGLVLEMWWVALIFLAANIAATVVLFSSQNKMIERTHPDDLVLASRLNKLTVPQFASPQQQWDAAKTMRDSNDQARAQMILGH